MNTTEARRGMVAQSGSIWREAGCTVEHRWNERMAAFEHRTSIVDPWVMGQPDSPRGHWHRVEREPAKSQVPTAAELTNLYGPPVVGMKMLRDNGMSRSDPGELAGYGHRDAKPFHYVRGLIQEVRGNGSYLSVTDGLNGSFAGPPMEACQVAYVEGWCSTGPEDAYGTRPYRLVRWLTAPAWDRLTPELQQWLELREDDFTPAQKLQISGPFTRKPEPEFVVYDIVSRPDANSPTGKEWGIKRDGCFYVLAWVINRYPDAWGFDLPDGAQTWTTVPAISWVDKHWCIPIYPGAQTLHAKRVRFRRGHADERTE